MMAFDKLFETLEAASDRFRKWNGIYQTLSILLTGLIGAGSYALLQMAATAAAASPAGAIILIILSWLILIPFMVCMGGQIGMAVADCLTSPFDGLLARNEALLAEREVLISNLLAQSEQTIDANIALYQQIMNGLDAPQPSTHPRENLEQGLQDTTLTLAQPAQNADTSVALPHDPAPFG